MLGREELDVLNLHKQALLQESSLNRLALRAEVHSLRSSTAWMRDATRASRQSAPYLLLLAPIVGFLLARGARRPESWLSRMTGLAKLILPLYRLWKSFATGRNKTEAAEPVG